MFFAIGLSDYFGLLVYDTLCKIYLRINWKLFSTTFGLGALYFHSNHILTVLVFKFWIALLLLILFFGIFIGSDRF